MFSSLTGFWFPSVFIGGATWAKVSLWTPGAVGFPSLLLFFLFFFLWCLMIKRIQMTSVGNSNATMTIKANAVEPRPPDWFVSEPDGGCCTGKQELASYSQYFLLSGAKVLFGNWKHHWQPRRPQSFDVTLCFENEYFVTNTWNLQSFTFWVFFRQKSQGEEMDSTQGS